MDNPYFALCKGDVLQHLVGRGVGNNGNVLYKHGRQPEPKQLYVQIVQEPTIECCPNIVYG